MYVAYVLNNCASSSLKDQTPLFVTTGQVNDISPMLEFVFGEPVYYCRNEKNGKASSSKRTKHINIRYFFITDRISAGEVTLKWCPTGDMIGDYATKALQGALFKKFRDQIMGVVPAQDPGPGKTKKPMPPDKSASTTPKKTPRKGKGSGSAS